MEKHYAIELHLFMKNLRNYMLCFPTEPMTVLIHRVRIIAQYSIGLLLIIGKFSLDVFFLFQKFSDEGFINDYDHFKSRTFELDRKLGSVLGKAFDDCLVTEAIFKLLQIFGTLIQRNLIAQELSERMPTLVSMLNQEMDEIRIIYDKQMKRIGNNGKPLIDKVE